MKNRKITALLIAVIAIAGVVAGVFGSEAWAAKYTCLYTGSDITAPRQCAYNILNDFHHTLGSNKACTSSGDAATEIKAAIVACQKNLVNGGRVDFRPGSNGGEGSDSAKTTYSRQVAALLVEANKYHADPGQKKSLLDTINKYKVPDDVNKLFDEDSQISISGKKADADSEPVKPEKGDDDEPDKEEAVDPGTLKPGKCTSIMGDSYCDDSGNAEDGGVMKVLKLILNIMTGGVVVAGTIGIVICGYLWLTARDNEQQMMKAKTRLIEVVIGLVAWVLMAVLLQFILPNGSAASDAEITKTEQVVSREEIG